jgi:hypothetical protein
MKIQKLLTIVGLSSLIILTAVPLRANVGDFGAQELSYDLFGSWGTRDREDFDDGQIGIGAGINYFFTPYLGVGADTYIEEIDFPGHLDISAIGRWPLESVPVAPYVFAGFGRQWWDTAQWTTHLGIGVEYRCVERTAIFFDAREVFADKSRDLGLFRLGVRINF